ncbi:MAG: hypothetical protein ACYDBQ_11395 [Thermoplasmatota archaeon]
MTFEVALQGRVGVDALVTGGQQRRQALLEALRESSPTTQFTKVIALIRRELDVGEKAARDVAVLLIRLYAEQDRHDEDVKAIAKIAAESVTDGFEWKRETPKNLEAFFDGLLGLRKGFALSAKAIAVLSEQPQHFVESRVITDLRPLFSPGSTDPVAMTVVHNLHVAFFDRAGNKDFYCACSEADLRELQRDISRALDKHGKVKALTKLPVVQE